ncbi:hypothetical protein [Plesiomonas sp.]|uniref:hypothetical protein n=1 Tax=Plesiomonas sp. TaxID=2486279 RepID=UPI003F2CEEB4
MNFTIKNKPGNLFSVGSNMSGGKYIVDYECVDDGVCTPIGRLADWESDFLFITFTPKLKSLVNNDGNFRITVRSADHIESLNAGGRPIDVIFSVHRRSSCSISVKDLDLGNIKNNSEYLSGNLRPVSVECNINRPGADYQIIYEVVNVTSNVEKFEICLPIYTDCSSVKLFVKDPEIAPDVNFKVTPKNPGQIQAIIKATLVII